MIPTTASEASDSEGSDINIQSALPKLTNKKTPKSPTTDILEKKLDKKLSTKLMIIQALVDLKSRKGVSMYAIKKYLAETYNVDTEKMNFYIKKSIKSAVEDGTIIQTKGIGATGSFRLAPVKEKKPKAKKPKKENADKAKDSEKKKKLKEKVKKTDEKVKKVKEKTKKSEGKGLKTKVAKESKEDKAVQPKPKKKKIDIEKKPKEKKEGGVKTKKVKITADKTTPTKKKAAMAKRKSIGSIIKPPKMKPRPKV
ncbi:hypothetical protein PYW08_011159 [Mythimna loreyi]|uniref:Uncharacterized protein n=1 Tax=Mythimna loreyi TaxID=667449 RepID=A0ACC2Q325_9NEOP|nr:hypothetical protein PYW08_011159 [Mythimna loreyi]